MADQSSSRRSRWRRVAWIFFGALLLTWLGKAFIPELASLGQDRIAIVRIEGPIFDSTQAVSELKSFGEDPLVKAIVVRIDSPGGAVAPSQEIYNAVLRVRREHEKKVVASMGTVAASGGYYIAVASDRILANPGTLTGSIGVIMQLANFQKLLEKLGVKSVAVKSGRYKDLGSPFRPMTDEDRQLIQAVMDDVHRQFIEAVADGRSLDVADVIPLADGRVFTGKQAKELLLVDDLGDLHDAIQLASQLGGVRGKPKIVEPERRFSLRDLVTGVFGRKLSSMIGRASWSPLMYLLAF
ncbi:MAG: signal peptide peptidase SppA [Nitrospirae bacterium]|nr:MAG: signal peptide peptidase SppA [Nitrospirota bacterium]